MIKLHCLYCGGDNIRPTESIECGMSDDIGDWYCKNCQRYLTEEEVIGEQK